MQTDYLIIGAGATGLAFADEMLTRSDAHMTIVERRHAPGGHWNDAYPFVCLHQPSVFYGVESAALSEPRIDSDGLNAGYLSLAEGSEVTNYFHAVMRERLLPSGRVRFLPLHDYRDGAVQSLASGETVAIEVRRKVVDAAYLTNSIPLTHERKFAVADGIDCIPPNELPRRVGNTEHFVVLGAGKTAIDSCVWLLEAGVPPASLTWVVPRDPWLWNRATTQPGAEFFDKVFGAFAERQEALARAESGADFAAGMESAGIWLRVDPDVEPQFFHGATISEAELEQLRRIGNVVRLGRVETIDSAGMTLANGRAECPPGSVYVDCTASALRPMPTRPVFDGERITLQMIRFPQLPFSAALIAFLEATRDDDADKNRFTAPLPLPDTIDDYLRAMLPDMMNRYHANRDADVRKWIGESRLEGYAKIARQIDPADPAKLAILNRIRESSKAAAANIQRLTS